MTRQEFDRVFIELWKKETVGFCPDRYVAEYPPYDEDDWSYLDYLIDNLEYEGKLDKSVVNEWYEDGVFHAGAPYRKEVSPDDNLGTYQSCSFIMKDGVIVEIPDPHWITKYPAVDFARPNFVGFDVGFDVYKTFNGSPEEAMSAWYNEIEMQY